MCLSLASPVPVLANKAGACDRAVSIYVIHYKELQANVLRAAMLPLVSTNLLMHQKFFFEIVSQSSKSIFCLRESGHFLVEIKAPMK